MKTRLIGLAFALGLVGATAFAVPAQATAATTCKSVTVSNRVSQDSGTKGNDWAADTLSRELTVCATEMPASGDWTYKATVTDNGTFVTKAGDSPAGTAVLKGGITGTIKGGFTATFTAPKAWDGKAALVKPAASTSTGEWVATAFPGAKFNEAGAVAAWAWTYTRACESFTNAEAGNIGDITEKRCEVTPVTPDYVAPTCTTAGKVTPKTTTGVKYTVDAGLGKVTVTATAEDGYVLKAGATAKWSFAVAVLTGDKCTTPSPSTSPSASPSPTKSPVAVPVVTDSPSNLPPANNVGNTLPKTGDKFPLGKALMYAGGTILIGIGAVLLGRRRRGTSDDTVQFTA